MKCVFLKKQNKKYLNYFDSLYYLQNNKDVESSGIEPLAHYITYGWKEKRNPSAYFDVNFYLQNNKDVESSGIEPLAHYIVYGEYEKRATSESKALDLSTKEDVYHTWIRNNTASKKQLELLIFKLSQLQIKPKISIIMPIYNPDMNFLKQAIDSLNKQLYQNWELCIADDCSTNDDILEYLNLLKNNERIKIFFREQNGHISAATNSAVSIATGEYILFFDQDDLLSIDCLLRVVLHIAKTDDDVIYSDDDKIDIHNNRYAPQFKPDWSPELLLSYMYFSHTFVVRKTLFENLGGFRKGYEGSQDYDFALRVTEITSKIGHIPFILYHWRAMPGSTAMGGGEKNYSIINGLAAVQDALDRRKINGVAYQKIWAINSNVGVFSIDFKSINTPSVTIIIPTNDKVKLLRTCIDSILEKTNYNNYKILIINNGSIEKETFDYLNHISENPKVDILAIDSIDGKFNYSRINNIAVAQVNSEFVLLLNNDTEVIEPDWLKQMVGYASLPGVGAVGAKLLFENNTLQHAGIVHGYNNGICGTAFRGVPEWFGAYLSYVSVSRNYSAVTAACLLIKKDIYIAENGLDEVNFAVAYNDVDFCYRLINAGYRNIYCSDAVLYHYEGYTRGHVDNPEEELNFKLKYRDFNDKYYSINLSTLNERFEINPFSQNCIDNKPKKIAAFSHNLNLEGAPNSMLELMSGISKRNEFNKIDVFSPHSGELLGNYKNNKISVNIITSPNFNNSIQAMQHLYNLVELVKNYDLVYANTMELFYVILAAKIANVPSIWNIRESECYETYYSGKLPEYFEKIALECFGYPYATVFVANSTANEKLPLNYNNNFKVIHNGLNTNRIDNAITNFNREEERAKLGILDKDFVVLLPGTVCKRKGQHDLVKAFQLLSSESKQKVKILIVGDRDSNYSKEMHDMVATIPEMFRNNIKIIPETKSIYTYYYISDIFICSSRVESFPRVILEAMYFGLPIITTPVYGITEQVRENINALFYNVEDVDMLAKHLTEIINDGALRNKFTKNSKILFKLITSYDSMVNQYTKIFSEAMST